MLADAIERLQDRVPVLAGRVHGAADFAELMRTNALPQVTPAAHVIPMGYLGGKPLDFTGLYRQSVEYQLAVVLTLRAQDKAGGRDLPDAGQLIDQVVAAFAGWEPDPSVTRVMRLVRARLVGIPPGALVYEITFACDVQLRITP